MGNKTGHLESVDAALRLLQMLGRDGQLRVTDAADELGVAASTAHRLLSTLRYRGFAVQAGDRTYRPGPAFTELPRVMHRRSTFAAWPGRTWSGCGPPSTRRRTSSC